MKAETLENGLLTGHSLRSSQTLLFNQEVWLLLFQSCLTMHNAEDWSISKSPNRYQQRSTIALAICVSIKYGIIDYP